MGPHKRLHRTKRGTGIPSLGGMESTVFTVRIFFPSTLQSQVSWKEGGMHCPQRTLCSVESSHKKGRLLVSRCARSGGEWSLVGEFQGGLGLMMGAYTWTQRLMPTSPCRFLKAKGLLKSPHSSTPWKHKYHGSSKPGKKTMCGTSTLSHDRRYGRKSQWFLTVLRTNYITEEGQRNKKSYPDSKDK